jgi:hypothetical protein
MRREPNANSPATMSLRSRCSIVATGPALASVGAVLIDSSSFAAAVCRAAFRGVPPMVAQFDQIGKA